MNRIRTKAAAMPPIPLQNALPAAPRIATPGIPLANDPLPAPRRPRRSRGLIPGLVACLSAACEAPPAESGFVRTDSAGIPILESFSPEWEEGEGWTIAAEPEVAIGAGVTGDDDPDNPPFGRIRGVSVLSDGSLVVGDISTSEVMVFDALGRLTHRFGGEGDGPGELRDFAMASTCGDDTIIASDVHAFNFFDSEGRFIRRLATADGRTGTPLNVYLVSADCQRFLVTDDRYRIKEPEGPEGLTWWDFAWTDDTFTGRDTIARVPDLHMYKYGIFARFVPWTERVLPIRMTGDDLVFGYSQRAELRVVAATGELKRILRWHATPDPITAEEKRRWNEEQRVGESGRLVQLDDFPWLPEHKAFFDRMRADEMGNLWVRAPSPPDPSPERWTVLSAAGRWLGAVRMPEGFTLSTVARGRVYGVHRDELGVATARVYRLQRASPAA